MFELSGTNAISFAGNINEMLCTIFLLKCTNNTEQGLIFVSVD